MTRQAAPVTTPRPGQARRADVRGDPDAPRWTRTGRSRQLGGHPARSGSSTTYFRTDRLSRTACRPTALPSCRWPDGEGQARGQAQTSSAQALDKPAATANFFVCARSMWSNSRSSVVPQRTHLPPSSSINFWSPIVTRQRDGTAWSGSRGSTDPQAKAASPDDPAAEVVRAARTSLAIGASAGEYFQSR
jgi:hypothetical protein